MKKLVAKLDAGEVFRLKDGSYTFEAWGGVHISRACEAAATWAQINNCDLAFVFNDISGLATGVKTAEVLEMEWNLESNRRAEAYRASPAYAAAQLRNAQEVEQCQQQVDSIVAELPAVLDDTPRLLECLCGLSDAADRVGVKYDAAAIADVLETKWKDNDCVDAGITPEIFQLKPKLMARYIVGQAINCLRHNMPPHPMIRTFTEKYLASIA